VCLATLVASVAILRYPFVGVVVFVGVAALLPFAVLPIRVVFAPTLIDIALTALLAAWLVRAVRREEPFVTTHLDPLLVLFIGLALVALVLGTGQSAISGETLRLFLKLVNSTLLFFSVVQVVRAEQQLATVLRTLLIAGAAAAVIAITLYAMPKDTTLATLSGLDVLGYPTAEILRPVAGTETLRATGTSVDPNILGGLLMLVGVVLVAQVLARSPILPRALVAAMTIPVAGALVLTYSRSSWVGLAAGIAFLAIGRQRRAAWILALGAAVVLISPQGRAIVGRLGEAFAATDQASVMRLEEYRNAAEIISRYPLFGIGFGGAPTVDLAVGVSSIYLLIAEQAGLIALGCFLAIVLAALTLSTRARPPRDSGLHGMLSGLEAAFVAALIAGLFDHYFFNVNFPHMVGLFWLIVALLVVASKLAVGTGSSGEARLAPKFRGYSGQASLTLPILLQ
jgi:polysaccharide biosynthesis protein PslJ